MTSMRTRTLYCLHGFQIPGKPEPWVSLKCKASRFCLKCWADHGQTFRDHGFEPIETEDRIQYGFLDIIHYVLKDRAYYRDQDRFESLEMELRMHLWEKRERIERAMREEPRKIKGYVRQPFVEVRVALAKPTLERGVKSSNVNDITKSLTHDFERPIVSSLRGGTLSMWSLAYGPRYAVSSALIDNARQRSQR